MTAEIDPKATASGPDANGAGDAILRRLLATLGQHLRATRLAVVQGLLTAHAVDTFCGIGSRLAFALGAPLLRSGPLTVGTLVVRTYPIDLLGRQHALHDPRRELRMVRDLGPLGRGQRLGLAEDRVWHPDLADIVQLGGRPHDPDLPLGEPHALGDHRRVLRDTA